MKNNSSHLAVALLMVFATLLASCDSTKQDYTLAIPADALLVMSLDVKSLSEKGDFKLYANNPEIKKLKEKITSSLSGEVSTLMSELVENPSKSGIDFYKRIYFYLQMSERESDEQNVLKNMSSLSTIGFVLPVKELNMLNKTITTLAIQKGLAAPTRASEGGYYTFVNNDYAICYNESALLIIFGKEKTPLQVAQQMIALKPENSIHEKPAFKDLQKSKTDVAMILNPGALPSRTMEKLLGESFPLEKGFKYDDLAMLFSLNFGKGEIVLGTKTYMYSQAWKDEQKKALAMVGKVDIKYLKMIPTDAIAILALNMDGKKYMEKHHPMLHMLERMGPMGKIYEELFELLGYLQGNAVAYAQIKSIMDFSVQSFIEGDEVALNNLTQMIPRGMGIESGRKGDYTYISMNAEEVSGKQFDPSFAETKVGKEVADSYASIYLNIGQVSKFLPLIGGQNNPSTRFEIQILLTMDYILFHQAEPNYGEWKIVMVDQEENSLKRYVSMLASSFL